MPPVFKKKMIDDPIDPIDIDRTRRPRTPEGDPDGKTHPFDEHVTDTEEAGKKSKASISKDASSSSRMSTEDVEDLMRTIKYSMSRSKRFSRRARSGSKSRGRRMSYLSRHAGSPTTMTKSRSSVDLRNRYLQSVGQRPRSTGSPGRDGRSFSSGHDEFSLFNDRKQHERTIAVSARKVLDAAVTTLRDCALLSHKDDDVVESVLQHLKLIAQVGDCVKRVSEIFSIREIMRSVQRYFLHAVPQVRYAVMRATRHVLSVSADVAIALQYGVGTFVALSMQRPQVELRWERVEALKLVQTMIRIIYGPLYGGDMKDGKDDGDDEDSNQGLSSRASSFENDAEESHETATRRRRTRTSRMESEDVTYHPMPSSTSPDVTLSSSEYLDQDEFVKELPPAPGPPQTPDSDALESKTSSETSNQMKRNMVVGGRRMSLLDETEILSAGEKPVGHVEKRGHRQRTATFGSLSGSKAFSRERYTTEGSTSPSSTTSSNDGRLLSNLPIFSDNLVRIPRHLIQALVAVASTPLVSPSKIIEVGGKGKKGAKVTGATKSEDTITSSMTRDDADLALRSFSLELLREILLVDPRLVASCDGAFQVLWDAVLQYEHRQLQRPLLMTILHVLGTVGLPFEVPPLRSVLWPLTTVESPRTKLQLDRARAMAGAAVEVLMRSYTGIWLLSSDPLALAELVRVIGRRVPVSMRMKALTIFERLIQHVDVDLEGHSADDIRPDLMHSYGAVLLLSLLHCGLTHQLVAVVLQSGSSMKTVESVEDEFFMRAKALLARVLRLNVLLLPAKLNRIDVDTTSPSMTSSTSHARRRRGGHRLKSRHRNSSATSNEPSVSSAVTANEFGARDSTSRGSTDQSAHQSSSMRGSLASKGMARVHRVARPLELLLSNTQRNASEFVFRTFADQLRKTRVGSTEYGGGGKTIGITTLAEMTVVEYDRQPGTVGPRDQLIVARLRSQLSRLASSLATSRRTRNFSESTVASTTSMTNEVGLNAMSSNGSLSSESERHNLTDVQRKELTAFLFYGLHAESGIPIRRQEDVRDMLYASGVVPQKQSYKKWNWILTTDILNLSQADSIRVREDADQRNTSGSHRILVSPVIYGTKFLHRLGGFFQWTDTTEAGEFISQPWMQSSLKYSFAAHRWLRLLVSTQEGRNFVSANGDRRGKLPISIVRALCIEQPNVMNRFASKNSLMDSLTDAFNDLGVELSSKDRLHRFKRVLSIESCQQTLARELIPLFAHMMNCGFLDDLEKGGNLKDETGKAIVITEMLHNLMESPNKDYITRTLLTYLDYTRPEAREKLSYVLSQSSTDLQRFAVTLLWELMRQKAINIQEFAQFGVRELKNLLHRQDDTAGGGIVEMAETILLEASYNRNYLKALIGLGPPINHICQRAETRGRSYMSSYGEQLVIRFMSMPEGLEFLLQSPRWLDRAFDDWYHSRHVLYLQELDRSFMSAHHLSRFPSLDDDASDTLRNAAAARKRQRKMRRNQRRSSVQSRNHESSADESEDTLGGESSKSRFAFGRSRSQDSWDSKRKRHRSMAIPVQPPTWAVAESNDLLWLMRMPWRLIVECRLPETDHSEEIITFLRVDSYIDVRPSAQRTRGVLRRTIQLHGTVLGPSNVTHPRRQRTESATKTLQRGISKISQMQKGRSMSTMSTMSSQSSTAHMASSASHARTSSRLRSMDGLGTVQVSSSLQASVKLDMVNSGSVIVPPNAELTAWVCIGMHPVSRHGDVADPLPLVPVKGQLGLHTPHRPPHIGMGIMQRSEKNAPIVNFERSLFKLSEADWACKATAEARLDAYMESESNGSQRFTISNKWAHFNFRILPKVMSPSSSTRRSTEGSTSSLLSSSRDIILETIDIDLKLEPERAPRLPMPPHFYGMIANTREGCERLRRSGHVEKFEKRAMDQSCSTLYRRAAMIALGHIGSSDLGFDVLRSVAPRFLTFVLDLSRNSTHLSLRGTCFVVLGLIAMSSLGKQCLADNGWQSPESPAAVSMPTNEDVRPIFQPIVRPFVAQPSVHRASSNGVDDIASSTVNTTKTSSRLVPSGYSVYVGRSGNMIDSDEGSCSVQSSSDAPVGVLSEEKERIIECIVQLSNGIMNSSSRKKLLDMKRAMTRGKKSKRLSPFMDPHFFSQVLRTTLNAPGLTLASRQFVLFDLFGELLKKNGADLLAEEMDACSRSSSPMTGALHGRNVDALSLDGRSPAIHRRSLSEPIRK